MNRDGRMNGDRRNDTIFRCFRTMTKGKRKTFEMNEVAKREIRRARHCEEEKCENN